MAEKVHIISINPESFTNSIDRLLELCTTDCDVASWGWDKITNPNFMDALTLPEEGKVLFLISGRVHAPTSWLDGEINCFDLMGEWMYRHQELLEQHKDRLLFLLNPNELTSLSMSTEFIRKGCILLGIDNGVWTKTESPGKLVQIIKDFQEGKRFPIEGQTGGRKEAE